MGGAMLLSQKNGDCSTYLDYTCEDMGNVV